MTSLPTFLFGVGLLLAACGGGTLFADGVKGRPIEFSEPPGERGKTAQTRLVPGQTRLDQWESELNRPFQGLAPGKSLDGMILSTPLPMPPPAVQSPRARELSDKKREWMFRTPEELLAIRTVEDKYKAPELTPDGRNRDDLRPMVRAYYDAAEAAQSPAISNQYSQPVASPYGSEPGSMFTGFDSRSPFMAQASPLETELRRALGWDPTTGNPRAAEATDFFKFNNGFKAAGKPTAAELQRVEDFKQILDFSNIQPDASTPNTDHMFSSPYVDHSFFDPPKPPVSAPAATLGGGLAGASIGASTAPSWTSPAPPPAEPAKSVTAPSSPFMNIPRRNF